MYLFVQRKKRKKLSHLPSDVYITQLKTFNGFVEFDRTALRASAFMIMKNKASWWVFLQQKRHEKGHKAIKRRDFLSWHSSVTAKQWNDWWHVTCPRPAGSAGALTRSHSQTFSLDRLGGDIWSFRNTALCCPRYFIAKYAVLYQKQSSLSTSTCQTYSIALNINIPESSSSTSIIARKFRNKSNRY